MPLQPVFNLPRQIKIRLPKIEVPGCGEDQQLAGEYILERHFAGIRSASWGLRFDPVCGFNRMSLVLDTPTENTWTLTLRLIGKDRVTWQSSGKGNPSFKKVVRFQGSTGEGVQWPAQRKLHPLEAPEGEEDETRLLSSGGGGGSAMSSSSVTTIIACPCPLGQGAGLSKVRLEFFDIENDEDCDECEGLNNTLFTLLRESTSDPICYHYLELPNPGTPCDDSIAFLEGYVYWDLENCIISYNCLIVGVAQHSVYKKNIPYKDWDFNKTYDLDFVTSGDYVCVFDNSSAQMKVYPDPDLDCEELNCGNKWGVCKGTLIPLPLNELTPDSSLVVYCCCDECGDTPEVEGTKWTGAGCGSGECSSPAVLPTLGGVAFRLSVPSAGSGGIAGDIVYFNFPGATFGADAKTIMDERVVGSADHPNAHVHKCDGSDLYYVCRSVDPPYGVYESVGRNKNRLERHANGWYSEIQGNTDPSVIYHFNSSGILVWIEKKLPSDEGTGSYRWTITHDTGSSYFSDPFGRRATTTYDGNGYPSKFEDAYGRQTQFTFNANGLPTSATTAESCTVQYRYDGSNRLTEFIAPYGGRISYAYDSDGWVSQAKYPDGGTYTFTYPDCYTTVITAPGGGVTTIIHDGNRRITAIINPLGEQTDYEYNSGVLTKITPPSDTGTLEFRYEEANQGVMALTSRIEPAGRMTYTYEGGNLEQVINPLGGRMTYVRDASDRQVATIDPLGNRTTFVYNSNGQNISQIDPLGQRTSYVYNSLAQVEATINPLGHRTSYSYEDGQRVTVTNPLSAVSTTTYNLVNQPLVQIDPLGNRTSYSYDSGGLPLETISPTGARTTRVYAFGRLSATVNPLGNRTSWAYDTRGNRIREQSPMSRITTLVYNAANRRIAAIDPSNLRSTTLYDEDGRVEAEIAPTGLRTTTLYGSSTLNPVAMISPDGARTSYAYNAADLQIRQLQPGGGIMTTIYDVAERNIASIDPLGNRSTEIYDAAGRIVVSINALGDRTTMVYDGANQSTATIDPLDRRSSRVYDAAGQVIASINPLSDRWTSVYDLAGRSIAQIDPLSRRTSSVYDADGRPVATIDAAGNRSTRVYDAASQTIAAVDARSFRTSMTYNADGQLTVTINPLLDRTTNVYDGGGRQSAVIDARGNRTTNIYDSFGRHSATRNPLGHRWTTLYNAVGQAAAAQDPLDNRTSNIYDSAGRLVATQQPLGQRTTTVYNVGDQVIGTIDANTHRSTRVYDALNRQIAQVNPLNQRMTNVFNAAGEQTAQIDGRGNRHSFTYDAASRQTEQIDALNRRTTLGYDAAGQQTLRLDPRGNRTTYLFDPVSRVIGRKYPDGSRATLAYDATGNRTKMHDGSGRYSFSYSPVNQMLSARNPQGKSLTYSYDPVSNRRLMHTADSGRFTYTYDAANQYTVVLNPFGERTSFSYDAAGRQTLRQLANGSRTTYVYDDNSRRTSVDEGVESFDYIYDSVGNPTSMTESRGDRTTWTYDDADQLLSERRNGLSGYANTFTYDAAGNRTLSNADAVRTTYVYDAANQLSYAQAAGGRTTYQFDANGNQRIEQPPAGNRTTTTWDYENQPVLYRLPDATRMTAVYDPDNRRVQKESSSGTTKFIWDPALDAYQSELDGSNVTQAVYTNPPVQYGNIISQRRGANSSWYHADSLGSTRVLTNSANSKTDTYLYDAWGNPIASSGSTVNPFRWVGNVGYYFDEETGRYYIRARTYQPTIARWNSVDPLFYIMARVGLVELSSNETIGLAPDFNIYRYAQGNSVRWSDPAGLFVWAPGDRPWFGEDSVFGSPGVYDVDGCLRFLRGVVTTLPVLPGQRGQHFKCARSLLKRFLDGNQTGTTCTSECQEALNEFDWADHFNEFASDFLGRHHDCGFRGRIDLSHLEWGSIFNPDDSSDLYYAFKRFTLATFEAACDVNCGAPVGCCCSCTGKCGAVIKVKDDYDFCSSLGNAPGPFARCGCIIERYRKQHGKPSGGTFKVNCSAGHQTDLNLNTSICYPKQDPRGGPQPR